MATIPPPAHEPTGPCDFCEIGNIGPDVKGYPWPAPTELGTELIDLCAIHLDEVLEDARLEAHPSHIWVGWCEVHGFGPAEKLCGCPDDSFFKLLYALPDWLSPSPDAAP